MSTGIVCEFNPFHNGHKYLIDKAKELSDSSVICAMSGDFVQRGEYAFADKSVRARWAVECGADIVLENPFPFSCATAEIFAKSAVSILKKSGCDSIAFGVESKEVEACDFVEAAKILLDEKTEKEIAKIVKQNKNIGYAVARSTYISEKYGERAGRLLSAPNALLGVEYAKAIVENSYDMKIFTVERKGALHDSLPDGAFASGSFLRENFSPENIDAYCPKVVGGSEFSARRCDTEKLYCALCAILFSTDTEKLSQIAEVPCEYAVKMKKAAETCTTYDEFFESLRAKHITDAKLRRMIIYTLAGVKKQDLSCFPNASFLLSFGEGGGKILRKIKKENTDFSVLSKISDIKKLSQKDAEIFNKQLKAERLFERMTKM